LESSQIYVGNKICAKVGNTLPVNDYVTFECQDENEKPKNVFDNQEKQEFMGTKGNFLKI